MASSYFFNGGFYGPGYANASAGYLYPNQTQWPAAGALPLPWYPPVNFVGGQSFYPPMQAAGIPPWFRSYPLPNAALHPIPVAAQPSMDPMLMAQENDDMEPWLEPCPMTDAALHPIPVAAQPSMDPMLMAQENDDMEPWLEPCPMTDAAAAQATNHPLMDPALVASLRDQAQADASFPAPQAVNHPLMDPALVASLRDQAQADASFPAPQAVNHPLMDPALVASLRDQAQADASMPMTDYVPNDDDDMTQTIHIRIYNNDSDMPYASAVIDINANEPLSSDDGGKMLYIEFNEFITIESHIDIANSSISILWKEDDDTSTAAADTLLVTAKSDVEGALHMLLSNPSVGSIKLCGNRYDLPFLDPDVVVELSLQPLPIYL